MKIELDNQFENLTDLEMGEYENCSFYNCNFSNQDFSKYNFIDCSFQDSNLSLVKIQGSLIQNCHFKNCKILGVCFEDANPFGLSISFENCLLNHSVFYGMNLKKTNFIQCQLEEVDFTNAQLNDAIFHHSNLMGTVFDGTQLENADFRYSYNLRLNPEINRLKKTKFSQENLAGLLTQYDIIIEP